MTAFKMDLAEVMNGKGWCGCVYYQWPGLNVLIGACLFCLPAITVLKSCLGVAVR